MVILALVLATLLPDLVEFTNGGSLEGEIVSETDADVTVRFDGGQVTLERKMIRAIRKGAAAADAPIPVETPKPAAAPPAAPPPFSGVAGKSEQWSLLWSPERRVGWRRVLARELPGNTTFEEESTFLAEDGKVESVTRVLEEAGPGYAPLSFLFRETTGGKELTRGGRVVGGRLKVETFLNGARTDADHPLPPGFRLPMAARAFVLSEYDRLPGGWKGTTYDPRTGEFVTLSLRCAGTERVRWEGEAVEVCVLRRERNGVAEEERVAADGTVLTADLNGPGLVAVAAGKERVDAVMAGGAEPASEEEKRARTAFASPEDGFRVFKPGAAWTFLAPANRDEPVRLTVKDVTGLAFVTFSAEAAPAGSGDAPAAALGAALERRLRASSAGLEKLEDGYGTLAGCGGYWILCDAKLKGDDVRTLAWTFARAGRVWTLAASAPRGAWGEARPYLERILTGFEWL